VIDLKPEDLVQDADASVLSTIQYPHKFELAAKFYERSSDVLTSLHVDDQLLLYSLHQQASVGPCNTPSPHLWNRVERAKWDVWKQLGQTSKMEAMFLFVRTLEEVCPKWLMWKGIQAEVKAALDGEGGEQAADALQSPSSRRMEAIPRPEGELTAYRTWIGGLTTGTPPSPRYQHSCTVVGKYMIVFGGHGTCFLADTHVLDLESMTWMSYDVENSPSPRAGHSATLLDEEHVLVLGGHGGNGKFNEIHILQVEHGINTMLKKSERPILTWTRQEISGPYPINRGSHCAAEHQGSVYLFGGESDERECLDDFWRLDLAQQTWERCPIEGCPSKRMDASMVRIGNHLVVFGGANAQTQLADVFVFDVPDKRWRKVSPIEGPPPEPRAGHACVLHGGRMIVMGGGNGAQGLLGMHIFDLETEDGEVKGSWSILRAGYAHSTSCLTVAREGAACVMHDSKLFLFGGFNGRYLNDVMMLRLERDADWALRVQDGSVEELRDACRLLREDLAREQKEKENFKQELNRLRTEHATVRAMLAQLEKMYYNSPAATGNPTPSAALQRGSHHSEGWLVHAMRILTSSWMGMLWGSKEEARIHPDNENQESPLEVA